MVFIKRIIKTLDTIIQESKYNGYGRLMARDMKKSIQIMKEFIDPMEYFRNIIETPGEIIFPTDVQGKITRLIEKLPKMIEAGKEQIIIWNEYLNRLRQIIDI